MNHKIAAGIALALYALAAYGLAQTYPKKCIEHVTTEERLKQARWAPFLAVFTTSLSFLMAWSVFTLMFE